MKLDRSCPFCGEEELEMMIQEFIIADEILARVACKTCGASTRAVHCPPDNRHNAAMEWMEGIIYATYLQRVKQ